MNLLSKIKINAEYTSTNEKPSIKTLKMLLILTSFSHLETKSKGTTDTAKTIKIFNNCKKYSFIGKPIDLLS